MDLRKTTEDLFRTETGNAAEIDKCLAYIAASFDGTGAVVKIERFDDASPVIYQQQRQYDARCAGARTY